MAVNGERERGVALILVMGLLVLVSAWAVASMEADWRALHRAERWMESTRALLAVESGLELAAHLLRQDARRSRYDGLDEDWAKPRPPYQVDEGAVRIRIVDANRFFNLNDLVDPAGRARPKAVAMARRLFAHVKVDPALVDALVDWMDADDALHGPDGAEDADYRDRPYHVKNAPLDRMEELLLVKGFDRRALARLRKVAVVRPSKGRTPINVNTAPEAVWLSLAEGIPPADVEAILEERKRRPFRKVAALLAEPRYASWTKKLNASMLTTRSDAFIIRAEAEFGRVRWREEAMVQRRGRRLALLYRQRVAPR